MHENAVRHVASLEKSAVVGSRSQRIAVWPDEATNPPCVPGAPPHVRPTEEYRVPTDQDETNSSATSNAARSQSAPAAGPSAAVVFTPVSGARSFAPIRLNGNACSRSETT
jgi:hypothetical protein